MMLQEVSVERSVHRSPPARVTGLSRSRFLLVAPGRPGRSLRVETADLWTAVLGTITSLQQPVPKPYHHRRPLFHLKLLLLLLFCAGLLVLSLGLSSHGSSGWESLPLREVSEDVDLAHIYHTYLEHRLQIEEMLENIESPAVLPPTRSTMPPTLPASTPPLTPTEPCAAIQYHQAYAPNYHFIMDNVEACETKTPFLVLMVPVAPANVAARRAIRQTWGSSRLVQGELVLTLFLLGRSAGTDVDKKQEKLRQESQQHHDIIQSDFRDSYFNLTIKTMVMMNWLATRCPAAAYAMKIDSDMFLNVDNLVAMLKQPGIPKEKYLTGMLMFNRPVERFKGSKWYVSKDLYPGNTYPTYTLGMGYVMSNDLPGKLVNISKSVKPFNIEDAYVGVCMKKLGLAPTSPPHPSQFKAYKTKYDRCDFSKVITYILHSPEELVKHWTDVKRPEAPCKDPGKSHG